MMDLFKLITQIHASSKSYFLHLPLFFICLLFPAFLKSQSIEIGYEAGPVLEIYPEFPHSAGAHRYSATYFPAQRDSLIWNLAYRRPLTGAKLSYIDLGSDTLGKAIGLQYLFSQRKSITPKLAFNWALGLGGVYFSNPYHYLNNPKNIANGSKLAFLVELNLGLLYQFTEKYSLSGGFAMLHSSNGHTILPNVGTNIPAYRLALRYTPAPVKTGSTSLPRWDRTREHSLKLSLGQNEFGRSTAPTNGPPQHIYLLSYQRNVRYSIKGQWHIGFEGYYNKGYRLYLKSQEISELEDKFINASALIVFVGHEYRYGHYGLLIQAGYNIHNPFLRYFIKENQPREKLKAHLPGKFGVNYYFKNPFIHHRTNFYVGAYIKSNVSQADFLETGAGILF